MLSIKEPDIRVLNKGFEGASVKKEAVATSKALQKLMLRYECIRVLVRVPERMYVRVFSYV